jgi:hypothetical protein
VIARVAEESTAKVTMLPGRSRGPRTKYWAKMDIVGRMAEMRVLTMFIVVRTVLSE